jgi:hypothetical protein
MPLGWLGKVWQLPGGVEQCWLQPQLFWLQNSLQPYSCSREPSLPLALMAEQVLHCPSVVDFQMHLQKDPVVAQVIHWRCSCLAWLLGHPVLKSSASLEA